MRVRAWFLAVLTLAILPGGCEKKRGYRVESDLCRAAYQGNVQEVQSLIARGVSIHTTDSEGRTPLHRAAEGGRTAVVDFLIGCGARIDAPDHQGFSPVVLAMAARHRAVVELLVSKGATVDLHLAVYLGDSDQVRRLVDAGADVDAKGPDGCRPLHRAVLRNQREIVGLLIAAGADPNATTDDTENWEGCLGGTVLHYAVAADHADLAEMLLDNGANVEARDAQGFTPLVLAARLGRSDTVRLLMAAGANPNLRSSSDIYSEQTPLEGAVEEGFTDVVELLLAGGADVNARSPTGLTPLHMAVLGNYSSAVDAEVAANVPAGADWERWGLARRKAYAGITERMLKVLIAGGAEVNAHQDGGLTPLHCAAHRGDRMAVEILLSNGADVNARTAEEPELGRTWDWDMNFRWRAGVTPLHETIHAGDPNIIDLLLGHGARVNARDASGDTPLHYAVVRGLEELIVLLIARGADVNARNEHGATPLAIALRNGHVAIAKTLLAAGAERVMMKDHFVGTLYGENGPEERLILHSAFGTDGAGWVRAYADHDGYPNGEDFRRDWIELLLANGVDLNERDQKGNTPLHAVISRGDEKSVSLLIDQGADVNVKNLAGVTPLHEAACDNRTEPVSLLLARGAEVNARANDGDTPLHNAALRGHTKVVQLLLAHGADPNARNNRGRTPLDEATRRGHSDIIQLLKAKPRNAGENEK